MARRGDRAAVLGFVKLLIDMNLSPSWVEVLRKHGCDAIHWTQIGDVRAPDAEIMEWARHNNYVVFTHDLDFGSLLAVSAEKGPSVIQVRTHDVTPDHLEDALVKALRAHGEALEAGALVTIDETRSRVTILPLVR